MYKICVSQFPMIYLIQYEVKYFIKIFIHNTCIIIHLFCILCKCYFFNPCFHPVTGIQERVETMFQFSCNIADKLRQLRKMILLQVPERYHLYRLNRKSFYYHFQDKYELINWIYCTEFLDSALTRQTPPAGDNRQEGHQNSKYLLMPLLHIYLCLFSDLSVSKDHIFCRCQRLQSHRTSRMELLCADTDLGAESKLESVRKPGGCIHIHCRRINLILEF